MTDTWQDDALCRHSDPDLWYSDDRFATIAAVTTCEDCPVKFPCLKDGLTEQFGIWGGWTPWQRRRLRDKVQGLDREARLLVIKHAAHAGPRHMKMDD